MYHQCLKAIWKGKGPINAPEFWFSTRRSLLLRGSFLFWARCGWRYCPFDLGVCLFRHGRTSLSHSQGQPSLHPHWLSFLTLKIAEGWREEEISSGGKLIWEDPVDEFSDGLYLMQIYWSDPSLRSEPQKFECLQVRSWDYKWPKQLI